MGKSPKEAQTKLQPGEISIPRPAGDQVRGFVRGGRATRGNPDCRVGVCRPPRPHYQNRTGCTRKQVVYVHRESRSTMCLAPHARRCARGRLRRPLMAQQHLVLLPNGPRRARRLQRGPATPSGSNTQGIALPSPHSEQSPCPGLTGLVWPSWPTTPSPIPVNQVNATSAGPPTNKPTSMLNEVSHPHPGVWGNPAHRDVHYYTPCTNTGTSFTASS
jgi:hypothetical protein